MIARYSSMAVFLLLVVLTAAAGAGFEAGEWFHIKMTKPSWSPPPWLFAGAWTAAWLFAASAAWSVWMTEHYDRLKALSGWLVLLVLNIAWTFLYFGMHRPGWAWLAAGLVVVFTIFCIRGFKKFSGQAAGLMLPFLLWMVFIWAYNFTTWTLNGGLFAGILL